MGQKIIGTVSDNRLSYKTSEFTVDILTLLIFKQCQLKRKEHVCQISEFHKKLNIL